VTTTVPVRDERAGVFAVGDVRSGSGKRAGAAVGEGSGTVSMVHRDLETV
jgi:thioredoxin reductase (NADPH)